MTEYVSPIRERDDEQGQGRERQFFELSESEEFELQMREQQGYQDIQLVQHPNYMLDQGVPNVGNIDKILMYTHLTIERARMLAEFQGMRFRCENSQRYYGPHKNYTGPEPMKGCEVFVGKIPRDCFEYELVPIFQRIAPIFELRIIVDFSGTNKGFCFVKYFNRSDALRCIQELQGYIIRGQQIGLAESVDNRRLYVGGIPGNLTKEEIFYELSTLTDWVLDVFIPRNYQSRCYVFVEYATHRAAVFARRTLISEHIRMFGTRPKVDWAKPHRIFFDNNILHYI